MTTQAVAGGDAPPVYASVTGETLWLLSGFDPAASVILSRGESA